MAELIMTIIGEITFFAVAVFSLVVSVRSFKEKGFIFNNVWYYATEQKRRSMGKQYKKLIYRQTAWVFLFLAIFCVEMGLLIVSEWAVRLGMYLIFATLGIALVYAIVSSIKISKHSFYV